MLKIPNYYTSESIQSQKNKILKQIDISKQNNLLLARKQQDYFKNQIEPVNETQDLTTEELMSSMIKLKEQFSKDIRELVKDFQTINEVLNNEYFDDMETLQIVVQIFPKIKYELTQGKSGQRFMSASFIIQSIKKIIEKWKMENDIKENVPEPQPIPEGDIPKPNFAQIDVDAEITTADFTKPLDITPFVKLDQNMIDDSVNIYVNYAKTKNLIDVSDPNNEAQLRSELDALINDQNGYNSDLILSRILIEKLFILEELKNYKSSVGAIKTRNQEVTLNKLEKELKNNELNFNYEREKLDKFKLSHAESLGSKSQNEIGRRNNQKKIDALTDKIPRNEMIDDRIDGIPLTTFTVQKITNILNTRGIIFKKNDKKNELIIKLRNGLKNKELDYQVGDDVNNEFFGLGFVNKDGIYVSNNKIGKGITYSKYKNIKIGRGLEIPEEKKPVYVQFGNFIIHQKQLFDDNILNLKYKSMGSTLIKRQVLTDPLTQLFKNVIEYNKINQKDYDNLTDNDKKIFDNVIDKAYLNDLIKYNRVVSGKGIINSDMLNINNEIQRFKILKGQIIAGNDNIDLKNEFKILLKKFTDLNRIDKSESEMILNLI